MPRGGRDQNTVAIHVTLSMLIPQCPVGGEIKTESRADPARSKRYHNAPWGARSKHRFTTCSHKVIDTTMPRGGRDQNSPSKTNTKGAGIPQCPVGGEIKTRILTGKTWIRDTTMPRGGRDQNAALYTSRLCLMIPQCPVGGEIKTDAHIAYP